MGSKTNWLALNLLLVKRGLLVLDAFLHLKQIQMTLHFLRSTVTLFWITKGNKHKSIPPTCTYAQWTEPPWFTRSERNSSFSGKGPKASDCWSMKYRKSVWRNNFLIYKCALPNLRPKAKTNTYLTAIKRQLKSYA